MTKDQKKYIYLCIAALIILVSWFIPTPTGLNRAGMQVIGIFIGVLLLWVTTGIDWPSLLCVAALGFIPEIGFDNVLKNSFGNSTFAFLLFTFMCTYALSQTNFIKRIAITFVTSKISQKGPWHLIIAFLLADLIIGLIMSPTVLFFIMLPILEEIYIVLGLKKGESFAKVLMIGLAICTSLSSGMTPIAHVFPVLAMGVFQSITHQEISYAQYMGFAIPTGLIIFILTMLIFKFILNPDLTQFKAMNKQDFSNLGIKKADKREKTTVIIFIAVVLLWVLPGLISNLLPNIALAISKYGTVMPPLIGVIIMAIVKIDHKPLININEAMVKGVSWPALIMASATLSLGAAMTDKNVGLTKFLTSAIAPITKGLSPVLLILLFISWAALESSLSSHMVTEQLVASIAVPVALASGSLSAAAITATIGLIAATGSAAPSSMPYVAIAGASGWTDAKEMMKYGFIFMIMAIVVISVIGYPLAAFLMR
ncbi:anion permease [Lactobacillus sp. ESL0791]|uniref:SLC13 family permease n=1 Tax=Lactobacillus sp. ESL0791 TaxID=2983234 RepID=UPI0023FA290E|nr:SLC13 family permease [Lactobacillus sp. ESL0791]MDF7637971.1 anion permease [Lactobacillus sp. ESL0791]